MEDNLIIYKGMGVKTTKDYNGIDKKRGKMKNCVGK